MSGCIWQGCDCAANWLILANSSPNFVIFEISVNQVRKCFQPWGGGDLYYLGTALQMLQFQDESAHFSQFYIGPVSSLNFVLQAQVKEKIATVKEESSKLARMIVQSPERMKNEMDRMEHQLQSLKVRPKPFIL